MHGPQYSCPDEYYMNSINHESKIGLSKASIENIRKNDKETNNFNNLI